jgi:hypothetical protein
MTIEHKSLLSDAYLRAVLDKEFREFKTSAAEGALLEKLEKWSKKKFQKETSAEIAFVNLFFEEIWGYTQSGKTHGPEFTCSPKYAIPGAGAGGGSGEADAALGIFGASDVPAKAPFALVAPIDCLLQKDGLIDLSSRGIVAVEHGSNCTRFYKSGAAIVDFVEVARGIRRYRIANTNAFVLIPVVTPHQHAVWALAKRDDWGIVTDMNEFRLYWRNTMPSQYERFVIKRATTDEGISLLESSEAASFQRFLFLKLFHSETLLTRGGPSELLKLINHQRFQEREIENTFYREYRSYREHLVGLLIKHNPTFPGTKGRLVRLAQKLIDRCIFVMFCEDMGEQLSFQNLLPDIALAAFSLEASAVVVDVLALLDLGDQGAAAMGTLDEAREGEILFQAAPSGSAAVEDVLDLRP